MAVSNQKLVAKLLVSVIAMFAFGFALVPLYDVFCQVTGINGRIVVKADSYDSQIDKSRTVTVEFITRTANGSRFDFIAVNPKVKLHPGELAQVEFIVKNQQSKPVFAQAVPSVSPGPASLYLNKTECFCFTQQTLTARQEVVYPMKFFLDPELPEDISVLTVSYTLYQIEQAAELAVNREGYNYVEAI